MLPAKIDPTSMRDSTALSNRFRSVSIQPRRTVAALVFLAVGAGLPAQTTAPYNPAPAEMPPIGQDAVLNWNTGAGKSYVVPAFEVPGFLTALSVYDRITIPHDVYDSTLTTALSNRFRSVSIQPRRTVAALVFLAVGAGLPAQTTAPYNPAPAEMPPI